MRGEAWALSALLLAANLAVAAEVEAPEPPPGLFEFLAEFTAADGVWVDPLELGQWLPEGPRTEDEGEDDE